MKILNYQIPTKQNASFKVLVLSDLHFFKLKDTNKFAEILEELGKNHYDAIYFAGDVIDATNVLYNKKLKEIICDFMKILGSIAPVYFVSGNHDLGYFSISLNQKKQSPWLDDRNTFKKEFLDQIAGYPNIYVLENETRNLIEGYTISGYDPTISYVLYKEDGEDEIIDQDPNTNFLKLLDPNKTNTLISHYPNAILELERLNLLRNVDLSIAGHNHNGCTQLKFPLEACLNLIHQNNRGLITPGKSIKLEDTKIMRGQFYFAKERSLIINPSIKTLASCTGILENLDPLFYTGASSIEYIPVERKLLKK